MATEESKLKNLVGYKGSSSNEDADDHKTGINLGLFMDKLTLGSKKKLLVLPFGGFIVHRAHYRRPMDIPTNRNPDLSCNHFLIYKRPFCDEFMKFCFERFEVGIWSSAMEHNILWVLNEVMGELKDKLLFIWEQHECTDTGFKCLENTKKPLFLKELQHIWQSNKYPNLPWGAGEYSSSNTLLITNPVSALSNPPNTAIFPEEYDPENKDDDFLGPDGNLRVFLDGLAESKDVQTYVKNHPFGKSAITPSHPDWNYYSNIVRRFGKKETAYH